MIFDRTLLFSNQQAITASAPSSDVVDLGATGTVYRAATALVRDVGKGQDIPLLVMVTSAFNNLTSLKIGIEVSADAAFTTPAEVASSTIPLASLTVGRRLPITVLPNGVNQRYLRIYYTVTGTAPTTGTVTAGVVMSVQTNLN